MDSTLLFAIILTVAFFVLLGYGTFLLVTRRKAILAERLETYAGIEEEAALATSAEMQKMSGLTRIMHWRMNWPVLIFPCVQPSTFCCASCFL